MTTQQPPDAQERATVHWWQRIHTFDSLSIPAYRNYFAASFLFLGAMTMTQFARPWIAFELGDRSAVILGITVATNHLPNLLLAPYAGAVADRYSKRTVIMLTAVAMAIFALMTAVGLYFGLLEWWHVAGIGVLQGVAMTFITPTRRAIIPELVPRESILNATALHTVELNFNRLTMFAVAGVVIEYIGAEWAFASITVMYLISTVAMFTVPVSAESVSARRRDMSGAVREGFNYAIKTPTIRGLLLIALMGSLFGQPVQQLLVLFTDVLEINAAQVSLLGTMAGIGSLLGSTAAASLGDFKHKGALLIGFFTLLGLSIILFAASSIYLLSLVLMIPVGFGHSGRTTVLVATLQTYVDPAMRGRVMALNSWQGGSQVLSIFAVGVLADLTSPQIAFGFSGAVILVYGLWEMLFSRTIRSLR